MQDCPEALPEQAVEESAGVLVARGRAARIGWLCAGLVLVGIGFVGIFVPLLPTTDFLLLALPCFARSSPRLESWLLNHPRFGPPLRAWRTHRAVPGHAKLAACVGMALGYGLFYWLARPRLMVALAVGTAILSSAIWVVRRPSPPSSV
ncbi:MAG: YbaN family protein [Sphingomonadales bacterium]|nr:YbaN family protein [Sphingomonadales bacterium]MDE2171944.1 YbaN family protein [Sphingomonadales bacterium]